MKTSKEILNWLIANVGRRPVAELTDTDCIALYASVALCPLISYSSAPQELFAAYRSIVLQMQESTRHLAYHAIAIELDWGHRNMIWQHAMLPEGDKPAYKCCFESGGGGQERFEEMKRLKL